MDKTVRRLESTPQSPEVVTAAGALLSWANLPTDEPQSSRDLYIEEATRRLIDEVDNWDKPSADLSRIADDTRIVPLPKEDLASLSEVFIDRALAPDIDIRHRQANAHLALAIGLKVDDEGVLQDNNGLKAQKVKYVHDALIKILNRPEPNVQKSPASQFALEMLRQLGEPVKIIDTPSGLEVVQRTAKKAGRAIQEHGKAVGTVAIAGVVATSIAIPSVANAATMRSSNSITSSGNVVSDAQPSGQKTAATKTNVGVDVAVATPAEAAHIKTLGSQEKATSVAPGVTVTVASPSAASAFNVPASIALSQSPAKPEASVNVAVATPTEAAGKSIPATVPVAENGVPHPQAEVIAPTVATPSEASAASVPATTVSISPSTSAEALANKSVQGKEAAEDILAFINNGGSVADASQMIQDKFGKKQQETAVSTATSDNALETNGNLVVNLKTLSNQVQATITAQGHSNVSYINTSLTALAVLDAAAHNQTILESDFVQNILLAGVATPADPYQAKLFGQYQSQAKTTLTGNSGTLLANFSTDNASKIEDVYAYALMSAASDTEQATQIQAIKTQEAAAAAAAQEQASGGAEATALNNLINGAQDTYHKNSFIALQFFINKGLSAAQAAGIVGNLSRESGSTMDPGIQQFGGGPGRGIAQWEGGRFQSLQSYAASQGKPWSDLTIQLNFIWAEMTGSRGQTFQPVKSAGSEYDAAYAFMTYFETPYVVINGSQADINAEAQVRAGRGQPFLDALNQETAAVTQQQQAAAAQAAAQAAAEKAAEQNSSQMSNGQDILNNLESKYSNGQLPDSALTVLNNPNITFDKGANNLNSDYYDDLRNGGPGTFRLNPEAANQLYKLAAAYAAQFNTTLTLGAAYRSLGSQHDQKEYWTDQGKPGNAAAPGHSNHGWGLAIDIEMAGGDKGGAEHQWLVANAPKFGWVWPNASGESWHFEYTGSAAQANNSDSPEPGLHQN